MSQEYNENCCWTIEKFSLFYRYFAIIDTADYLADQLFIKHKVRVGFGPEFVCPDAPYRVIMCKCRKRDVDAFLAAIRELPNKMLLCGYPDYLIPYILRGSQKESPNRSRQWRCSHQ